MPSAAVWGMVALVAALVWIAMDTQDRQRIRVFLFIAAIPLYGVLCVSVLQTEDHLFPAKFDAILYHLDELLELPPFRVAATLRTGAWGIALDAAYRSLLIVMALWYGMNLRLGTRPSILRAYMVEFIAGPLLYGLLPACGPIYAFANYRSQQPTPPLDLIALSGNPNAVPSLHMATALLLVLFAPTRVWRTIGTAFAAITALATLSTGEHYAIDLVIGLPFGLFAGAVANRRGLVAAVNLGIVLAWMVSIRCWPDVLLGHRGEIRLMAAATVLLSVVQAARFREGSPAVPHPPVARTAELGNV